MGIRCYCPQGHKLNVKAEQAGKIGICPKCRVRFRIPLESTRASHSHKTEDAAEPAESVSASAAPQAPAPPVPSPEAPASPPAPDEQDWYILGGDGRQYGPVSRSVLVEWIAEHRIVAGTIVWRENAPKREAREIFPELGADPAAANESAAPAPNAAPVDELDALRRAARDSQKSALQKRVGLNRKKNTRRDLFIVVALSIVIVILMGILIALLLNNSDKPESVPLKAERPAATAADAPPAPQ